MYGLTLGLGGEYAQESNKSNMCENGEQLFALGEMNRWLSLRFNTRSE